MFNSLSLLESPPLVFWHLPAIQAVSFLGIRGPLLLSHRGTGLLETRRPPAPLAVVHTVAAASLVTEKNCLVD